MAAKPGIHLLYGNDEFAIAGQVAKFAADFKDTSAADMNTVRIDARTTGEDELNTAVNAMPFLSDHRLVILTNPSSRYTHPSTQSKFLEFLEQVPPTTQLVLTESDALRKEHWLLRWAQKNTEKVVVQVHALPRKWEMPRWIAAETKKLGGEITPEAAGRLAEMVGEDTRQAAQELLKLLTYVNYSRKINEKDVEAVAVVSSHGDVFAMVDALATGNAQNAQHMLHRLLDEDDPLRLFGMVVRQFRLLLIARDVIDSGGGQPDVTKALGMHRYVAEKAYNQAQKFDLPGLKKIYRELLLVDERVKTGQIPMDLALDILVVQLAQK